ncbi:MAG: 6-hydroxymethylpterin diphosphokinase MptE-like protein [Candidatus Omnitrophota bacterium]
MTLYENNLHLLRQKNLELAHRIQSGEEDARISLQTTQASEPTLIVHTSNQALALHHPGDPLAYSREFLAQIPQLDAAHNVILMGCGLGYLPLLLLQRRPAVRNFLIFEPSLTVFRAAMQSVDLQPLLQHPSVQFVVGAEPPETKRILIDKLMDFMANPPLLIEVPASAGAFPEWVAWARKAIQEILRFGQSGLITKFRDGPLCLRNLLGNIKTIAQTPGALAADGLFRNVPAIIVAAGPSLSKNIDRLSEAQDRFLLIACDTAYEMLRRKNIHPHFIVTVDPTELNEKHFPAAEYGPESILAFDPESRPEIVAKFPTRLAYMTDKHPFFAWLDRTMGGKGVVKKGLMVSQAGFWLAHYWGCSPLILVGQDLALDPQSGRTHAAETALCRTARYLDGDEEHVDVPLIGPEDRWHRETLFWVEGIDGRPVPTVHNLLVYLRAIEQDLRGFATPVIDATEGGAKIQGTQIMTLAEVIEQESDVSVLSLMDEFRRRMDSWKPPEDRPVQELLRRLVAQRAEMAREGLQWLEKNGGMDIPSLQKQLANCQEKIFAEPAAEYLIEYAAPKQLFEFLKLGPANEDEERQRRRIQSRFHSLLNAVLAADETLREIL